MQKSTIYLISILISSFLLSCQNDGLKKENTTTSSVQKDSSKNYMEPGYVAVEEDKEDQKFRPTLPLEQAGFNGSGADESRLKNEFEFMFDKTWKINGRVMAGDDNVYNKKNEIYNFNRNGSYNYIVDGSEGTGTWKGWMKDGAPIITVFPGNVDEKVSEWNLKNTGKTMIWSGTTSYKDNAIMIQFVLNK